jgi:hypothetical protein
MEKQEICSGDRANGNPIPELAICPSNRQSARRQQGCVHDIRMGLELFFGKLDLQP